MNLRTPLFASLAVVSALGGVAAVAEHEGVAVVVGRVGGTAGDA